MKGMLKILVIAVSCGMTVNAYAMANGFYLGLMLGPATHSSPSLKATVIPNSNDPALVGTDCNSSNGNPAITNPACIQYLTANPRASLFGARIFVGNQFNQFAAFEAGGTFISSIRYNVPGVPTGFRVYGSTDQRVRDIDLVLKGMLPLSWFSVYAKAGVAFTYITSGGTFNPSVKTVVPSPSSPTINTKLTVPSTNKFKYSPTFSLGASYDIDQSWQMDLSLNTISVGNNIGNITFFALGISYHFTDKYCGQFLCDD